MADTISYNAQYPLWLASFIIFNILYYVVSPWLSERMVAGYSRLSEKTKIEWHTMTVSNLHSPIVISLAVYVLINDEAINKDVVWGKTYSAQIPITVTLGFITSDFFVMLFKFPLKEAKAYLIHHLLTAIPFFANITFGPLTYFAVFRILAELSTPFVNQRWFYDVLGMKSSRGYFINGILLMIAFFVARLVTMPSYYYMMYQVVTTPVVKTLHWSYLLVWIGGSIGLDVLNLIWFRKIVRGAMKIVLTKPAVKEEEDSLRNRVKGE